MHPSLQAVYRVHARNARRELSRMRLRIGDIDESHTAESTESLLILKDAASKATELDAILILTSKSLHAVLRVSSEVDTTLLSAK